MPAGFYGNCRKNDRICDLVETQQLLTLCLIEARTRPTECFRHDVLGIRKPPHPSMVRVDPHFSSRNALSVMMTRIRSPAAMQNPHSIKLLIVDKEPSVRFELTELCRGVADLQVLGEAESGRAAIDAAENLAPDLLLIDVALPDMSGFDVLRNLGNDAGRLGIMTSHQPDFAEQAIAEGAVDYLIKPVNPDRFAHAIARVRQRYSLEELAEFQLKRQMLRLLGRQPKFLVGESRHRLYPLDIEKIDYIEADGNYVTIRTGDAEYISRNSIKRLASELADFGFVRIDRSILLNIRAVHFAEPIGHGALAFTLCSGTCLHSSKTYRETILRILPWHHCRGGSVF
jgi:two-component system, LytTR family, response regulator